MTSSAKGTPVVEQVDPQSVRVACRMQIKLPTDNETTGGFKDSFGRSNRCILGVVRIHPTHQG